MNSFSNRSAGRLPHRIVPLSRDGGGKRATQASCTRAGCLPWEQEGPVIMRESLHPHDEVRMRIMNITGDVLPAGRSLPAIQGIPVGRPEVSTLTVTLGELASRGRVLPRWRVLSLNITEPNHLCLRALLSASPPVRTAQVGSSAPGGCSLWTVCAVEGRLALGRHRTRLVLTHSWGPRRDLTATSRTRSPQCCFPCARMCMCVCVYIPISIYLV